MHSREVKRRLLWHGILILLLGLAIGALVPILVNPRMGVAAHVGGVMSGMFLLLVGLIWEEIRLPTRAEKLTFWLFLYASYTGWLAQFLAAVFGTSWATPLGGAGAVFGRKRSKRFQPRIEPRQTEHQENVASRGSEAQSHGCAGRYSKLGLGRR